MPSSQVNPVLALHPSRTILPTLPLILSSVAHRPNPWVVRAALLQFQAPKSDAQAAKHRQRDETRKLGIGKASSCLLFSGFPIQEVAQRLVYRVREQDRPPTLMIPNTRNHHVTSNDTIHDILVSYVFEGALLSFSALRSPLQTRSGVGDFDACVSGHDWANAEITIALICISGYSTASLPIPVVVHAHSCHVLLHLRLVSSYQEHAPPRRWGPKACC